jgi:glycosyltransferase involved in cell wall biosynthesis
METAGQHLKSRTESDMDPTPPIQTASSARTDGQGEPSVTVVVTAYNRKAFIAEALRSVSRQTARKSSFEVIVVKNFEDPKVDDLIASSQFIAIQMDDGPIGGYLSKAIARARGEIICFLDDDDEWFPEKLEEVIKRFSAIKDLGFYGNDYIVIGENGQPAGGSGTPRIFRRARRFAILSQRNDRPKTLWRVHRRRPNFNNSCIAVLKSVMAPYIGRLEEVAGSEDSIVYYCTLASGRAVLVDDRKLTRYRVHGQNKSAGGYLEREQHLAKSSIDIQKRLAALRLLDSQIGCRFDRSESRVFGFEIATELLLRAIVERRPSRRALAIQLPRYAAFTIESRDVQSIGILALAVVSVLSPKAGQRIYANS